jgi:hypothetical protein
MMSYYSEHYMMEQYCLGLGSHRKTHRKWIISVIMEWCAVRPDDSRNLGLFTTFRGQLTSSPFSLPAFPIPAFRSPLAAHRSPRAHDHLSANHIFSTELSLTRWYTKTRDFSWGRGRGQPARADEPVSPKMLRHIHVSRVCQPPFSHLQLASSTVHSQWVSKYYTSTLIYSDMILVQ